MIKPKKTKLYKPNVKVVVTTPKQEKLKAIPNFLENLGKRMPANCGMPVAEFVKKSQEPDIKITFPKKFKGTGRAKIEHVGTADFGSSIKGTLIACHACGLSWMTLEKFTGSFDAKCPQCSCNLTKVDGSCRTDAEMLTILKKNGKKTGKHKRLEFPEHPKDLLIPDNLTLDNLIIKKLLDNEEFWEKMRCTVQLSIKNEVDKYIKITRPTPEEFEKSMNGSFKQHAGAER